MVLPVFLQCPCAKPSHDDFYRPISHTVYVCPLLSIPLSAKHSTFSSYLDCLRVFRNGCSVSTYNIYHLGVSIVPGCATPPLKWSSVELGTNISCARFSSIPSYCFIDIVQKGFGGFVACPPTYMAMRISHS